MDAIKKVFTGDKKSHEKTESYSSEVQDTTNYSQKERSGGQAKCEFAAQNLEQEAQQLKQKACQKLDTSEATLQQAKAAQAEVEQAAAKANTVTNKALRQEAEGQKTLAQAGHKLMEAGAKLQEEAAQAGQAMSAEINVVQKGRIQQNTNIEVPNVPASELHVIQNRAVEECRPMANTQVYMEQIGKAQGGYVAGGREAYKQQERRGGGEEVYKREEVHAERSTEIH